MKEKFAKSQNFTLGVSFGAEREAAFEHAKVNNRKVFYYANHFDVNLAKNIFPKNAKKIVNDTNCINSLTTCATSKVTNFYKLYTLLKDLKSNMIFKSTLYMKERGTIQEKIRTIEGCF